MKPDSIFAPNLTKRQRWNRFKHKVLRVRPVIVIDNNPFSIICYLDDMNEKYGEGWLD